MSFDKTQKALLLEQIQELEADLKRVIDERKKTDHHILWKDLPKEHQFLQPVLERKRLMDAVRMIAYRAETAMCALLTRPTLDTAEVKTATGDPADGDAAAMDTAAARRVLQDLFVTEADLRPDPVAGLLHVEVHRGSRPAVDRTLRELFNKLNEMEFRFPGTNLQIRYQLVGDGPAAPNDLVSPSLHRGKEF